jgi:Ca2+/Na+ antiporter
VTPQSEIKQLEKAQRLSKRALPVALVLTIIAVLVVSFGHLSLWQAVIVLLLTARYLIGDFALSFNLISIC